MAFDFNLLCKLMDNGFKRIPELNGYCSRFVKTTKMGDVVAIFSNGNRAVRKASGVGLLSIINPDGSHDVYRHAKGLPVEVLRHGSKGWEPSGNSVELFERKIQEMTQTYFG